MALTLSILQTRVRRSLQILNNEGYKLISKGHLRSILNSAQQQVRIETFDRLEQYTGTFTANQRDHSLPTDFLREKPPIWISPSGTFQGYPCWPKTYDELVPITVRLDSTPDAVRGDGTTYYYYHISSDRIIYIDPIFSTATTFHLFYAKFPTDMTSPSDTPDMEENLHELVLRKACVLAAQDMGDFRKFQEQDRFYKEALNIYAPFINSKKANFTVSARSY